ncbi:MAG: histidine--tRNA ligase [Nitrososphaeraceae archaeon]|nr:histidine--tRNA ligase [Nitrososphaeraceae archaeon]
MRDLTNNDTFYMRYIQKTFFELVKAYNFQVVDPSPLELLSTLEAKSGPSIINEIYGFMDKGGRNIALRYDLTVGMTRFATSRRDMRIPVKLATFGGVWRYDEPQAGRYRYFHQWDIEIYDNFSLDSDAETIEFVSNFFLKLGFGDSIIIEISDRRIIEEYIKANFKIQDENMLTEIFRAIDKVPKKGIQNVCDEYKGSFDQNILRDLLEFSKIKGDIDSIKSNPKISNLESIKYLEKLFLSLRYRNVNNIRINLGIVRGLDYYSGMVFEVFDNESNVGSLVGGGRYDKLPIVFGRSDIGAAGAAGGVERIILALQSHKNIVPSEENNLIYIANSGNDVRKHVLKLGNFLRKKKYCIEYDFSNKALKKQLSEASAKSAKLVLIIGPEEIAIGKVRIRNMETGSEFLEDLNGIENRISSILVQSQHF